MKHLRRVKYTVVMLLLVNTINVQAHPGRLDGNGGHTVRTEGYGEPVGSYHYHDNEGSNNSNNGGYNSNNKNDTYGEFEQLIGYNEDEIWEIAYEEGYDVGYERGIKDKTIDITIVYYSEAYYDGFNEGYGEGFEDGQFDYQVELDNRLEEEWREEENKKEEQEEKVKQFLFWGFIVAGLVISKFGK